MPNPDLERVRERIADIAALRHKAATEPSFNSTVQEFLSHHVPLLIDDAERLVTAHAAAEAERDNPDVVRIYCPAEFRCEKCCGRGRLAYPTTSTWTGRVGGATVTEDVCDKCWGTGSSEKSGANLRALSASHRAADQERDSLRAAVAEFGEHKSDCGSRQPRRVPYSVRGASGTFTTFSNTCTCGLAKHLAAHERGEEG